MRAGVRAPVYFPALDGLRMVCCTAVIVSHALQDPRILGASTMRTFFDNLGLLGVDVFFALSGFLITRLLLDEIAIYGRAGLVNFYGRRAVRIWPVYFAALALGFGLAFALGERFTRPFAAPYSGELFTRALPHYLSFLANLCPVVVPTALGVLWSVSIEEQFYFVFPPLFARSRRRMPALLPILIGLGLALAARTWLVLHDVDVRTLKRHTLASADQLLLGALVAQLSHRSAALASFARRLGGIGACVVLCALLALTAFTRLETAGPLWRIAQNSVAGVLCAALVGTLAFGDGPLSRLLSRPTARALGSLTYATYVFHMYALVVAWAVCRRLELPPWPEATARCGVAIFFAFVMGYASKRFIEGPSSRLRARFTRHPTPEAVGSEWRTARQRVPLQTTKS